MVRIMKLKLSLFLILIVTMVQSAWTQGCCQCKLLAVQGSVLEEAYFGSNVNNGILFLMIIPYLILMFLFREQVKNVFSKLFSKRS